MDYSSRVERLAVTFEDGSTGLCHTADASMKGLHVNQWINEGRLLSRNKQAQCCHPCVFTSGAESYKVTCARIGDCANMVAVGCTDGTVILFRQTTIDCLMDISAVLRLTETFGIFGQSSEENSTPVPSPVRRLNLSDWGHGPEITGNTIHGSTHATRGLANRSRSGHMLEWGLHGICCGISATRNRCMDTLWVSLDVFIAADPIETKDSSQFNENGYQFSNDG